MLNELKEYEEYSFDLRDFGEHSPGVRLKYRSFVSNDLAGIERAMMTVARHFLFDGDGRLTPETKARALSAVKLWTGIEKAGSDDSTDSLRGWASDFIRYVHLRNKLTECQKESDRVPQELSRFIKLFSDELENPELEKIYRENQKAYEDALEEADLPDDGDPFKSVMMCFAALKKLDSGKKQYSKEMFFFDTSKDSAGNDLKAVTYEGILAKAFDSGPLKRYYLCCSDPAILERVTVTVRDRERKVTEYDPDKNRDIILKTVSAFLLGINRDLKKRQKYARFNVTDTVNWLRGVSSDKDYNKYFNRYTFDGKYYLFAKSEKISGNTVKLKVNARFSRAFDLVEEDGIDEWIGRNPDGSFYSDPGSNRPLEENTRY